MGNIRDTTFRKVYRLEDKKSATKDIQYMLNAIMNEHKPELSGDFDTETRNAVELFQQEYGIDATGIVDRKTLDRMAYRFDLMHCLRLRDIFNWFAKIEFPLALGDSGEFMTVINYALNRLVVKYRLDIRVKANWVFGKETLRASKELRQIYMLDESEVIDEEFFIRLFMDYRSDAEIGD